MDRRSGLGGKLGVSMMDLDLTLLTETNVRVSSDGLSDWPRLMER
jgi:hypothetical protein